MNRIAELECIAKLMRIILSVGVAVLLGAAAAGAQAPDACASQVPPDASSPKLATFSWPVGDFVFTLIPTHPAGERVTMGRLRVNAELLGYMRSVMKSAALDSAARLKGDSAFISQSDSLCAVAVRAYNAIPGGTHTALYVVVAPGLTYAVMAATPDDKLITLTWFSRR